MKVDLFTILEEQLQIRNQHVSVECDKEELDREDNSRGEILHLEQKKIIEILSRSKMSIFRSSTRMCSI